MIDFVFRNTTDDKTFTKKFFQHILKIGAQKLDINKKIEISLNLVSEDKMRELNRLYRNKDKATDVLSFPLSDETLSKYGIMPLGDIFICPSFAKVEAKRENIDIKDKLAQLTVHGFLHLLGYDHEKSKRDSKKMFDLENQILNKK